MSIFGILLTVLALFLIYYLIQYTFSDDNTLNKMTDGQTSTTIDTSSLEGGGTSLNFSYSIWIYVNDWNYKFGEPKVVFVHGSKAGSTPPPPTTTTTTTTSSDAAAGFSQPCPLVFLGESENNCTVVMSCEGTGPAIARLENIPLQKWVNITICVYGRTMDLYMDGKLVKTVLLPGVPNVQPNVPVMVTPNGGFSGWTSNLMYYADALNPQDVWNIYDKGYGGNSITNFLKSFQVQISLLQNGVQYSSFTV